jgi:sugar lactone lactonase YvrE
MVSIGDQLIVAETFARRITAFTIDPADGGLHLRRVWAELDGPPDGICLDPSGDLWVALLWWPEPGAPGAFVRVREGGAIVDRIPADRRAAIACAIGGDQGHTLLLVEAALDDSLDGTLRTVELRS